ncbi:transmembrane protein, putative (macronuclear) [Tetrahymena thermophila SB210]|uniref:Transmembrane protein, putative n=1 Tax=Tetrahymena thermophila (strain SB210) TaxID=312017 RepID=Q241L8_TETTS|nr:transmembrane protein, putative [Tetrahymena thermophila SB210]EAS02552.2 transmembrane protein, putative [Tetrahymena thermophila SB210]|eukprot:XP_001022797.2 transmembrane protein, putative [Tetrahymena thermophila SB210]
MQKFFVKLFIALGIIKTIFMQNLVQIGISYLIIYIKETNSIIYNSSDTNLIMYSTLSPQGYIIASYELKINIKLNNPSRYAFKNNMIYLTKPDNSLTYFVININEMIQGGQNYAQELPRPALYYPCTSYVIINMEENLYLTCFDNGKIFVIKSSTFEGLFQQIGNVVYKPNPSSSLLRVYGQYFIIMENIIFIDDNQYQYSFQADISSFQLINEKYNIYLINKNMCKVQLSEGQFSIISSIQNVYENFSDVIEFYEIPAIIIQIINSDQFQIYNVQNFSQIPIVGNSFPSLDKNQTYFQYLNFIYVKNSYFELKYNALQQNIQIEATLGSQTYISFQSYNDFRFYNGFSYLVIDLSTNTINKRFLYPIQKIYNKIPGCSQSGQLLSCPSCQSYYYLQNGQCVPSCSDHYFVQGQNCQKCDQTCLTCKDASPSSCLTCIHGRYLLQQDNTCITCDQNSGYLINGRNCTCQDGYSYYNSNCQKLYLVYKSGFTTALIQQIQQQVSISSKSLQATTTFLSFLQNIMSQSSFGIAINGLTCMKLSYLILLNTILPNQIYTPLNEIKNQCPLKQYRLLNVFELVINQNQTQFQNQRYSQQDISFNIIYTSGQAITLSFICLFTLALFYFLIEKCQIQKVQSASKIIYDKLISSFAIQFLQLGGLILVIGINQQIKQFFLQFDSDSIGLQITYVILFISLVFLVFQQQYICINRKNCHQNLSNFNEITRKKIQNETISESRPCKNFMIIYLIYESFFVPVCFITFSESWMSASIVSIIIQSAYLCIFIYLKPFHSKLTNFYFIIDSLLWLSLFVQYLILNIVISNCDINEKAQFLDNLSYSFIITFQLILFELTIYMILNLISEFYQFIIRKKNKDQDQLMNQDKLLGRISKIEISEYVLDQNLNKIQQLSLQDLNYIRKQQIVKKQKNKVHHNKHQYE